MEKLLEQFIIIENKCKELLITNKELILKINRIEETNRLLKEQYEIEIEEVENKLNRGQVRNGRQENPSMNKIDKYISEIDNCLDILKTMK